MAAGIKLLLSFFGNGVFSAISWNIKSRFYGQSFRCDPPFHKNLFVINTFIIFPWFYFCLNLYFFLSIRNHSHVWMVKSWTLINRESLYLFGDQTFLTYFQAKPADCLHWAIGIVLTQDRGYLTLSTAWRVPLPLHFPQGVAEYSPGIKIPSFSKPSLRHSWVGQNLLCDDSR